MESQSIKLKCSDTEFSCDSRLLAFSKKLNSEKALSTKFSSETFSKVLHFYSSYNFDANAFPKQPKHIETNSMKENLSEKDMEVLKEVILSDSELRVYMLKDLLQISYALEFVELKEMLLTALAAHFKCGVKEEELAEYKVKNGLEEKWILKEEDIKKLHKESIEKLNLQIEEALKG